jgi:hypothetical protein
MKKELRFFSRYSIFQSLICVGLTLVLIAGLWFTKSGDNLFAIYIRMYAMFVLLFPFCFSLAGVAYRNVALSFGAKRISCFWALEIVYAGLSAVLLACAKLVEYGAASVPEAAVEVLHVGPVQTLILMLACLTLVQLGLLLGGVGDAKRRGFLIVILILVAVAIAFGVIMALATGVFGDSENAGDVLRVSLASPLWLGVTIGFSVATVVFGSIAYRQFEKAVVSA